MLAAPAPPLSAETERVRLQISELYLSVQGESTWAGLPCTFVRLTGCPLRCVWCDTAHAFTGGDRQGLGHVLDQVRTLGCPLVEVTGGEPLAQPNCIPLLQALLDHGYTVLLETSGAYSIADVPRAVHKVIDLKCPDSGESHRNLWSNFDHLAPHDEIKCVLASRADYEWARDRVLEHDLPARVRAVLFSCVFGSLAPAEVVEWMTSDQLWNVRLQLQAHKFIWPPDAKGV